jgi:hypothetical protein
MAASRLGGWLLGLVCALGVPAVARADRSFDVAMANPAVDAYGLTVIDRAQTPQRFEFGLQSQFGWSHNPLRLNLSDLHVTKFPESAFNVIEQQYTVNLGFFLGLADFFSVAVSMPMGVNVYDDEALGSANELVLPPVPTAMGTVVSTGLYANQPRQNLSLANAGPRDPRLSLKARFYGGQWFEVGLLVEGTLPIGNSGSFLGEKSATLRPRLLMGVLLKRVVLALSVGAIVRETSELYDPAVMTQLRLQVGHELTWGAGLSVKAHRVVGFGLEGIGTVPLVGEEVAATAMLVGSVYLQPTPKWKLTLGGGGGLIGASPRNADGRVIFGLSYSLSPRAGGLL